MILKSMIIKLKPRYFKDFKSKEKDKIKQLKLPRNSCFESYSKINLARSKKYN